MSKGRKSRWIEICMDPLEMVQGGEGGLQQALCYRAEDTTWGLDLEVQRE